MRRNVSLNFKVGSVVAIMAIGSVTISWVGMSKLSALERSLTNLVEVQEKNVKALYHFQKATAAIALAEKNFIIDDNQKDKDDREKTIASQDTSVREAIDGLIARAPADDKDDLNDLKKAYNDYLATTQSVLRLAKEGKLKDSTTLSQTKGRDTRLEVEADAQALLAKNEKRMSAAQSDGAILYQRARAVMILATFLSLGLGLFLAVLAMRSIGKSVSQAIQALTNSSSQLNVAAQNVAATSSQISQASTEQASVVQETASSIEEMNSMVAKNSESARKASEVSEKSQKSAVRGKEVVDKMIQSIQEIDSSNANIMTQIGQSNEQLSEIVNVISGIATKTQVINDIVFQTKLLSFNASVEAARAGEHGKGFAVVAEEVGNLAQMSGNAAREITGMLDESIRKVEGIVQETKTRVDSLVSENKAKVGEGVEIAKECGGVLDEIVGSVSGLTEMATSISSASQEQAHGVREITLAMNQLDQVTQQNAAASEQASNAATQLSKQADSLKEVVTTLTRSIYGDANQKSHVVKSSAPIVKEVPAPESKKDTKAESAPQIPKKQEKVSQPAPKAKVIPLTVKTKATPPPAQEESAPRLATAGTGSLASLPSPDDERFKDI